MTRLKIVAALAFLLLAIVIVIQNTESVETRLLWVTLSMPRALLLLVTFLLGMVVGGLGCLAFLRKGETKSA